MSDDVTFRVPDLSDFDTPCLLDEDFCEPPHDPFGDEGWSPEDLRELHSSIVERLAIG